ncbi:MAG: glycine--tRNA ligase subunit beta, partial [Pseudomonadota bacterium]
MADLLFELFSEEIPAGMQARATEDLKRLFTQGMVDRGLTYEAAAAFATPRRLTLSVTGLPAETPDVREERKGPRVDAPEKALEGFLRSTGLTKDKLEARDDKKGQVWFAVIETPGRTAGEVIAEVADETIRNFPWPRSMRWGSGDLRWIRPLRSIMCVVTSEAGVEVVPFEVGGIVSGGETEGHRFMAPGRFAPKDFDDYAVRLEAAKVVLDPTERRARIWADATNMAFAQGLEVIEDKGLLEEVAGLVEWPVVLMGEIEERFLALPPEVLRTSMKEHQKFFSVRDPKSGRIVKFVTVANIETPDRGATILAGNQRVLAARLSDALFFWENDLRVAKGEGMAAMAKPLENVTFHNKLGSVAEQVERIAALAREIAPLVGADPDKAEEAARIAKADLASEMVYEFPELQGVMGRYYALEAGHPPEVAEVCATHRSPLGPSDQVPSEPTSVAVALADKIDLLTGFWAIDEKPTGSKDPFALRRAALGIIRIVLDGGLRVSVDRLFDAQVLRHQIAAANDVESRLLDDLLAASIRHGVFGDATRAILAGDA